MKKNVKETILIVDDAPDTLEVIKRNLESKGYLVISAPSVREAIKVLNTKKSDLVITDYKMPGETGFELIEYVRENFSDTEIMMVTGYATIEGAVKAVKKGAEEYLSKPFTDTELFAAVERTLDKLRKRRSFKQGTFPEYRGLFGRSYEIEKIYVAIKKLSESGENVFIYGLPGTEIRQTALAIYYNSRSKTENFITYDFEDTDKNLNYAELFGEKRNNAEKKDGLLKKCGKGTLFLNNVFYAPAKVRIELEKVLKKSYYLPLYSEKEERFNGRIIASAICREENITEMNKTSKAFVKLFGKNVVFIPALSERKEDLPEIINYYMSVYSEEFGKKGLTLSDKAISLLMNYQWIGNISELKYLIRAIVEKAQKKIIDAPSLPVLLKGSHFFDDDTTKSLSEVEQEYIKKILRKVSNNKTKAAEILGIDRKTLREKIKS